MKISKIFQVLSLEAILATGAGCAAHQVPPAIIQQSTIYDNLQQRYLQARKDQANATTYEEYMIAEGKQFLYTLLFTEEQNAEVDAWKIESELEKIGFIAAHKSQIEAQLGTGIVIVQGTYGTICDGYEWLEKALETEGIREQSYRDSTIVKWTIDTFGYCTTGF